MTESATTAGELRARLLFDPRCIAKKREGEKIDHNIAGLVVGTLQRTAAAISKPLDLGSIQTIRAMGAGEALTTTFSPEETSLDWYRGISSWEDLETASTESDILPDYPLVPDPPEIKHLLAVETGFRSCSFQRLASGNWEHATFDPSVPIVTLENVAMMMMQIDILCKQQGYPRGRYHLRWERGGVWFWISEQENLMLVLTPVEVTPVEIQFLTRCGDAFLLA